MRATARQVLSNQSAHPLYLAFLFVTLLQLNNARVLPSNTNNNSSAGHSWSSVINQQQSLRQSKQRPSSHLQSPSSMMASPVSTTTPKPLDPTKKPASVSSIVEAHRAFCRQFRDSETCTANGCCLANYTVSMKTMRGNRQMRVSECVSKVPENHFCVMTTSPIRQALDMLVSSSTGRSSASKVFSYLQCPCATGLECMTDRMEASISICRKPNSPPDLLMPTDDDPLHEDLDSEESDFEVDEAMAKH